MAVDVAGEASADAGPIGATPSSPSATRTT